MRRRRLAPWWAVLVLISGCARAPRVPPAPPPAPSPPAPPAVAGYETRIEGLARVDASALRGRRVALDPGHGGFFRGALGVDGLTEAEVNLGVALHLWGLLRAAGTEVFLTRSDDRDFLAPADSSLRADLAERSRLAAQFQPDVFLSIHHNADARGLHTINETQTYYKLGDEGPSLDLAQSLHRQLVRGLGIAPHRLVPGNYFVLRQSPAPAVLTEASYITNPAVEQKLELASKQRLEAEALFLGLVDYFATPAPVCESLALAGRAGAAADSVVSDAAPTLHARVRGAFDQAEVTLDGEPLPLERVGGDLYARPARPLAAGAHRAEVRARLAGARAARPLGLSFTVRRAAARLALQAAPPAGVVQGGLVALRAEVLDAEGFRVPDSLRLAVHASGLRPRDTVLVARGEAWAYFRADSAPPRRGAPKRRPGAGLLVTLLDSLPGVPRVAAAAARMKLPPRPTARRLWAGFLAGYPDTLALQGAELAEPVLAPPRERGLSPDGFYWTALDDSGRCDPPALLGYRPVPGSGTPVPLSWSARFGGALQGQRIVLDPEGGGEDAAGLGPTGSRGASLNLEVARALAGYLRSAGARVLLTREGDYALSEVERVQRAEGFLPHRVLRIGHRAEAPRLGYYFASAVGKRWAARAAAWLGLLGVAAPPAVEDAQYVLQQTSCPALYVSALPLGTGEGETRLLEPGFLRREAYALLVALAEDLHAEPVAWPADSLALAESGGAPAARALAAVGGLLHQADSGGVVRFARTEPGALEVQAVPPRGRAPLGVLLESSRATRIVLPPPGP